MTVLYDPFYSRPSDETKLSGFVELEGLLSAGALSPYHKTSRLRYKSKEVLQDLVLQPSLAYHCNLQPTTAYTVQSMNIHSSPVIVGGPDGRLRGQDPGGWFNRWTDRPPGIKGVTPVGRRLFPCRFYCSHKKVACCML